MRNRNNDKLIDELLDKLLKSNSDVADIRLKRKAFHITITRNTTGEKLCDEDTDCIVGAYSKNEDGMVRIGFSSYKGFELLGTIDAAKRQADELIPDDPFIRLLMDMQESKN